MGGDNMASDGCRLDMYNRPKVFLKKDFIIGYTTSFRMGQLLEHVWDPPENKDNTSDMDYLVKDVLPSLINVFEKNKYLQTKSEDGITGQSYGGIFLLAYKNRLYRISEDFAIIETVRNYCSCGCGEDYANGAMEAMTLNGWFDEHSAEDIIKLALKSAESCCAMVKVNWDNFKVLHK